jgi:hypothetical protein
MNYLDALTLDYDPKDLPAEMAEICEVIGFQATLKLVAAYGGRNLNVPKVMTLIHPLYTLLGDKAIALSFRFPGRIYISSCRKMKGRARKRLLESMRFTHTREQMAQIFEVSERRIYQILA